MPRRLPALALVIAAIAAGVLPSTASTSLRRASAGYGYVSGDDVRNGGPIHGMIVADANSPIEENLGDLPRLAQDGVNMAVLYITKYFDDLYHPTISNGTFTPTNNEILAAVDAAHSSGLTVQLDPMLWASGTYHWRGMMDPGNMATFWPSYRGMILNYAKLAESAGVEMFSIGSEYRGMEKYTTRWRELARDVRTVYHGKIIYMGVTQSVFAARFWNAVDYIGISPYFSVSYAAVPSYAEMLKQWRQRWLPALADMSHYWHRPVLFNETGYQSSQHTAQAPADKKVGEQVSQTAQANAYAAVLDAARTASWLKGIIFFQWSPPVTPIDQSYSPRDKKAECVMAKRWASPTSLRLSDGSPIGCLGALTTGSVLTN